MGLLDGGLAAIFGSAFSGVYLDGAISSPGVRNDTDEGLIRYTDPTSQDVSYQEERVTEAMRRDPRYTDKDARVLVLQIGRGGPVPRPTSGQTLTDKNAARWTVVEVGSDPANTYWDLHTTPEKGPPPEPEEP